MPIDARFSDDPVRDAPNAYAEIAKGVFQVWRFLSHARRGPYGGKVAEDCLGRVVTADPWLVMGQRLHPEVMAVANAMADASGAGIEAADRRRVRLPRSAMMSDRPVALGAAASMTVLWRDPSRLRRAAAAS